MDEKWDRIDPYRDGLAVVYKTDEDGHLRWGLIDEDGKEITPCKWYYEEKPYYWDQLWCSNGRFHNGFALARETLGKGDCYRILTRDGRLVGNRCWTFIEESFDKEQNPLIVFSRNPNSAALWACEEWAGEEETYYYDGSVGWPYGDYFLTVDGTVLTPYGPIPPDNQDPLPEGWELVSDFIGGEASTDGFYDMIVNPKGQLRFPRMKNGCELWWDEIRLRFPERTHWDQGQDKRLLYVRSGKYWGALDPDAGILVPCRWDSVTELDPWTPGFYLVETAGQRGLYHEEKGLLSLGDWDRIDPYRDGLAVVYKTDEDGRLRWGLIDEDGKEITPCKWIYEEKPLHPELRYCSNGRFHNGFALVRDRREYDSYDDYRILTRDGRLIGNRLWSHVEELFDEDRHPIRVFGRGENTYRVFSVFEEDSCYADPHSYRVEVGPDYIWDDAFYYLCWDGTVLTPSGPIGPEDEEELPEGWYEPPKFTCNHVRTDCGFMNAQGEFCPNSPEEARDAWLFEARGCAIVQKGSLWGLQTREQDGVCVWDRMEFVSCDLIRVKKDNRYGILDLSGREIIPCRWEYVEYLPDESFLVRENVCYGMVSRTGETLHPCQWEHFQRIPHLPVLVVKREGYWGSVGYDGKILIPCRWHYLNPHSCWHKSLHYLAGDEQGNKIWIDKMGNDLGWNV